MSSETGYAQGWKPSPGDEIGGKIIDIAATDNGWGAYPVITLMDEGGTEVAVHAFHDVLKGELARRRPKVGDELNIKYLGQPQGKNYHAYRVRGGHEASFDWGAFGGQSEPRQDDPPIQPSPVDAGPLPPKPPAPKGEQFGEAPPF